MENLRYGTATLAVSMFVKHSTSTCHHNNYDQTLTPHLIIAMGGIGVSLPRIYVNRF